jgi:alkylhydroperoxidase family enzyme
MSNSTARHTSRYTSPTTSGIDAARHYTDPQLATLVISIATIKAWNRLQAVTRQISGDWVEQVIKKPDHQPA